MSRGLVPGLGSPHPFGEALPGLYQDDSFTQRLCAALDEVLAPVVSSLDTFDAYLDPALAPADFVGWLASWVGVIASDAGPLERQRALVRRAVEAYRWRGTVRGMTLLVWLYTGVEPEIVDTGGVRWSPTPLGEPGGDEEPLLVIRLRAEDPSTIDVPRLDSLIAAAKPAHIPHRLEVR
ncbi:MAG: phage tail protein [Egibacteraceae bacterium]